MVRTDLNVTHCKQIWWWPHVLLLFTVISKSSKPNITLGMSVPYFVPKVLISKYRVTKSSFLYPNIAFGMP